LFGAHSRSRKYRPFPGRGGAKLLRFEPTDRRRIVLLAIVTAACTPLILNGSRGAVPASAPTPGGVDLATEIRSGEPTATVTDASTSSAPTTSTTLQYPFLVGPSTTQEPPPVLIGVPAPAPGNVYQGLALYRTFPASWQSLPRPCLVDKVAPSGTTITITNLNNAKSTTCIVATQAALPEGHVVAVSEKVFAEIADITESPVPVRISFA
jgi:hypothetical protein